jgi:hypothetical protein
MMRQGSSIEGLRSVEDCLGQITRAREIRGAFVENPPVSTPLIALLVDAATLFTELQINYALVGGLAAMLYGRARFTEDVDFVAAGGHEATLAAHSQEMRAHHFDPACTWKLYHDSGVTIDLWKDAFADGIAQRAREITVGGHLIRVAEVHDLIAMKLRAGRFQDDYDISEILKANRIDESVLAERVTAPELERFGAIRRRLETNQNS